MITPTSPHETKETQFQFNEARVVTVNLAPSGEEVWRSGGRVPLFLNFISKWRRNFNYMPCPLHPQRRKFQYPTVQNTRPIPQLVRTRWQEESLYRRRESNYDSSIVQFCKLEVILIKLTGLIWTGSSLMSTSFPCCNFPTAQNKSRKDRQRDEEQT
jgi:hypothetical protein